MDTLPGEGTSAHIELSAEWYREIVDQLNAAAIASRSKHEDLTFIGQLYDLGQAECDTLAALEVYSSPSRLASHSHEAAANAIRNSLHWVCAELRWWRVDDSIPDWMEEQYALIASLRRERSS